MQNSLVPASVLGPWQAAHMDVSVHEKLWLVNQSWCCYWTPSHDRPLPAHLSRHARPGHPCILLQYRPLLQDQEHLQRGQLDVAMEQEQEPQLERMME